MTCIVGLRKDGRVYMGADSAGSGGSEINYRADGKVFLVGDMLFGFCGSYRLGQVLRYHFNKPKHEARLSVDEFLHTVFLPSLIKLFGEHGILHKKEDVTSSVGLFLVGYRGRLFRVDYDYQIGENLHEYDAIGSGGRVACGAMYVETARYGENIDPTAAIHHALRASAHHTTSVAGPFTVMVTP